ncbi:hypothetical protein HED60_09880 [Planctomycetales bacterium ZRK34]|nr:hypothetical protein HED60_09880 [Planctomycetales bacterium ZRK34]
MMTTCLLTAVCSLAAALPGFAAEKPSEKDQAIENFTLSDYYHKHTPNQAKVTGGMAVGVLYRTYRSDLTRRIDRAYGPSPEFWIDASWAAMSMKAGLVPQRDHAKVAGAIVEMWTQHPKGAKFGHKGIQQYITQKHGIDTAGNIMIARTNPPQRQQMRVREKLMKVICLMHEFQQVLLENADKYKDAVMPGYTHLRHAQPTTLGHYLLSIYDPIDRSVKMLEDSYHAMSLNELGCGALAGTSWDIDRELVSEYLGCEGLIENTNDAVSYADGYVLVSAASTNIMMILSRLALELEHWSTLEYDFIDFEIGAGSFMMPNKRSNQGMLEKTVQGASTTLGALVETSSMSMKLPHGDMNPMAYAMQEGPMRALTEVDLCTEPYLYQLPCMIVKRDVMLATARQGYSCSTELANVLVRKHNMDYRTAHDLVNHFVVESAKQNIPSEKASLEILQAAAEPMVKHKLDITEAELRRILDPVHFVEVTDSRGGVSPKEVARMVAERKQKLIAARARHLARIEKLEAARAKLLADLRELAGESAAAE